MSFALYLDLHIILYFRTQKHVQWLLKPILSKHTNTILSDFVNVQDPTVHVSQCLSHCALRLPQA